ncbi:MAG: TIGR01777 family oxidoreductase [Acidobacteriota bacterium]|nr:TIGR01777 family oxidoreductase [Acidobacteriota bacterium]
MPTRIFESTIPTSPAQLFAWHARAGAFERLRPPWQRIEIEQPAPVEDGSRVRLRLKKGPFRFSWLAEHRDVVADRGFTDEQVSGPFARWVHRHEFEATATGGSILRDRIDYALPGGALGRLVAGRSVDRDLESTFAYRHATTARDLARHGRFGERRPLRVAVTGASGLVGSSLLPFLTTGGHTAVPLAREGSGAADPRQPRWSPEAGLREPETLEPFDAVVHLAGEGIASGRWSPERKAGIRDSRVRGTRNLVHTLGRLRRPPRTLVCASAVGFYGSRGDQVLAETSAAGEGFLAATCQDWEAAALEAQGLGIRVVLLRFGVILTPAGGALAKMLLPFRLGGGGVLGSGRQYMSWITIDDALGAVHQALMDERLAGAVNATTPEPVTNRDFTKTLGRVLGRPTVLPLPAPAARLLLGEMADEMLLASCRAAPAELTKAGFVFDDPTLEPALARLLGKARPS